MKGLILWRAVSSGCLSGMVGAVCVVLTFAVLAYASFLMMESLDVVGVSTKPGGLYTTRP
jgi:hypothetical protein